MCVYPGILPSLPSTCLSLRRTPSCHKLEAEGESLKSTLNVLVSEKWHMGSV